MDPKEQLRQVEEEMARDEAEAKRLSRPDEAGGMQPPGSGQRPTKGRVYWLDQSLSSSIEDESLALMASTSSCLEGSGMFSERATCSLISSLKPSG